MTKQQSGNAIQALLNEKIRTYADAFCEGSRQLFVDSEGALVHPGEFGSFRESITRDYLQAFVPQRMAIDTGFVVTASGKVSTQCDVVIYDRSVTPLLQNANRQRFFPVESVCAIGEVKSVLKLVDLKKALRKLAMVKSLRDSLYEPWYVHCSKEEGLRSKFEPERDERDQLVSFLICERFDFDFAENAEEILSCYLEAHPKFPVNLRHNFVLSINDGLLTYLHPKKDGTLFPFPTKITEVAIFGDAGELKSVSLQARALTNRALIPFPASFEHMRHFSSMLHQALTAVSVLFPDMSRYIPSQDEILFKDIEPPR